MLASHPPHCWPCLLTAMAPSAGAHRVLWRGAASPVSPVVVHDLVVQVLLVGQVPVGRQVLLVRLLVEVTQLSYRGHRGSGVRGNTWPPQPKQSPVGPRSPGQGHRPGGLSPALTLQQVGDEQRRALVTAGQPPQRQVLLDLEGEEVPVEGDRSPEAGPGSTGALPRGVGGCACPCASPCARPCFNPRDAGPRGHRRSTQAPQKDAAGHHCDQYAPAI